MTTENDTQSQIQDNPNPDNGTTGTAPDKGEKTVPYSRFSQVNDAKKAAEETLSALVDELKDDVPEQFQGLIPNLPPAELVKWLRNATKTGLFASKTAPSGPDAKRPGSKPATDFTNMSATEKMVHGYKN